jgi:hypothetical protein
MIDKIYNNTKGSYKNNRNDVLPNFNTKPVICFFYVAATLLPVVVYLFKKLQPARNLKIHDHIHETSPMDPILRKLTPLMYVCYVVLVLW